MNDQSRGLAEAHDESGHFSDALALFAATVRSERVGLGMIIEFMGQRSIGTLLLVLALPMALPIPTPGLSVVFGVPLIFISAQLLLGRRRVWLPARLARRSIARTDFVSVVERVLPTLHFLERLVRPRIQWMAGDWAVVPVGAICLLLAVIITLPIPLGHVVPGAAIAVLALGLIERDGLAIALGLTVAALGLLVVTIASTSLAGAVRAWLLD
jgi:hypothetical protein